MSPSVSRHLSDPQEAMCGLPLNQTKTGRNFLASTLANPDQSKDRFVFLPHMHPGEYAIINRDWRYIRYGKDGEELYNLNKDPNGRKTC